MPAARVETGLLEYEVRRSHVGSRGRVPDDDARLQQAHKRRSLIQSVQKHAARHGTAHTLSMAPSKSVAAAGREDLPVRLDELPENAYTSPRRMIRPAK